jgi:dTDP-4-dehydrorhamnose reductase
VVAKELRVRHLWVSTDYVYAGDLGRPLREEDPVSPLGVYGASKVAGEQAIAELYPERSLIVRTSSLHGRCGENFVHTMLKLFASKPELKVVADQSMSPTWAGWLAEALLGLCRTEGTGIVHASGSGGCTWYEFAEAILTEARERYGIGKELRLLKTTAAEFARPARRPSFSVMNTERITTLLGRAPCTWREGLRSHLAEIRVLNSDGSVPPVGV